MHRCGGVLPGQDRRGLGFEVQGATLALREDCATGRACMRPEEMNPFSPKRRLPRMRLWPAAAEK